MNLWLGCMVINSSHRVEHSCCKLFICALRNRRETRSKWSRRLRTARQSNPAKAVAN